MSKPNHTTIMLIRTSPTAWDAEARLCGRSDVPPTGEGLTTLTKSIREAGIEDLRSSLSAIYAAPDDLSVQCAKILVSSGDTKVKKVEALHELDFGLWEGVLTSDLGERFPRVFTKWRERPGSVAPPDGESLDHLLERLRIGLYKSLKKTKSSKSVGLVLRPYAWSALTCWLKGEPLSKVWDTMGSSSDIQVFSIVDLKTLEPERATTKIA